jgi:CheY-like chemotaxis protein
VVKGLVELHGGRVTAESAGLGRGSRFTIWLPVSPSVRSPATASAAAPGHSPSGRILVVDDNRDAADSLALLLEAHGHDVRAVYDGHSAVEVAPRFRPQIVLLDLGMPGLDGFETARRLRATLPDAAPYLVAITGWGQERERRQATAAGFDQHFVKPVDPNELTRLLSAVIA